MLRIVVLLFFVLLAGGVQSSYALFNTAKVTIKVVDESGRPIEGANVGLGFEYSSSWETRSTSKKGLSNFDGLFSASGKTNGHIGFRVTKDGYYKSTGSFDFEKLELSSWKPWNPELVQKEECQRSDFCIF